jgi:hypothetical protein
VVGVTVGISAISVPVDEKLDDYLSGWKKNWEEAQSSPRKRLYLALDGITGAATTDKDGRFKLTGAGAERIALVSLRGGSVARGYAAVITRAGFDPKPYNDAANAQTPAERRIGRQSTLYGPDFTYVAEAAKVIEGVVTDATTGKPLAGIHIDAMGEAAASGETDKDGKYRLEGAPNQKSYTIFANPLPGSPYLRRVEDVDGTPGAAPVHADFALVKGVIVSGRVIDKQTGKGVMAGIRFAPLPKNEYFAKPGFDGYKRDHTMQSTDADGRFRVATIPGPSLLMVQVHGGEKMDGLQLNPYTMAVPDPDHKELFKHENDGESWLFTSAGGQEFLSTENLVKVVDLKEDAGEVKVELAVERGKTAAIALEDPDGKPLTGVVVSGLTAFWPITFKLNQATATVFALDPAKPRRLLFVHPQKNLGATAVVRGDEKEPVVVKLGPLGAVTGRLLDTDGSPLGGARVVLAFPDRIASELYRYLDRTSPVIQTDKEGKFTLPGIVPNVKFQLQTNIGNTYFVGEPRIGAHEVTAGKTLDLGERKLKPLQ